MKKSLIYFSILLMAGCALNKQPRTGDYPTGLIFPLDIAHKHAFSGMNLGQIPFRDDCLFVTTRQGGMYCYSLKEKKNVWTHQIDMPWSSPAYLGDSGLYAVTADNHIIKLSYEGQVIWNTGLSAPVTSGICESAGAVYYGDENGMLQARDADTGDMQWSFDIGSAMRSTPRFSHDRIFFGSSQGILYILDRNGEEKARFETGGEIQDAVAVEDRRVFFGSADKYMYCADWTREKVKWKMKTGGEISAPLSLDEKNIYLTSGNNVLYCFNKKNGTMKWWRKIPAYTYYAPLLTPEKVVVSSSSPKLLGFNQNGGKTAGEYAAAEEVRSNPVWNDPHLLITVFHDIQEKSELLFLKKAVYVIAEAVPASPQSVNQNIEVTARTAGFFQPEFEFSIQRFVPLTFGWWPVLFMPVGNSAEVMQPFSEESTWAWFPEKHGAYMIIVKAKDGKETAENQMYYLILPPGKKTKKGEAI